MTPPRQPSLDELAAEPVDEFDAEALSRIAGLYEMVDPVPAGLVDRIQFGLTLDALHAEIAELQRADRLVGVRSDSDQVQSVTFTSATLTTMITITLTSADRARIDGWVAPGGGVEVELRTVERSRSTTADGDGRFVFDDIVRGLVQFVLRTPGGPAARTVITPSIEI